MKNPARHLPAAAKNDLACLIIFLLILFLPFMGKPYHIDEPFFLAIARHILQDPFHPLAFEWNWYGRSAPMATIAHTPLLLPYLLAPVIKLTGGNEWMTRLLFFPFDAAAAAGLYLLAARFLSKPLLPVMIVIASPAYLINMNHLMPEKLVAAFGFWGLYALVQGVSDGKSSWFWASAVLFGTASMSKYNAVFFLVPAAAYALYHGTKMRRILGFLALAATPLSVYLLWDLLCGAVIMKAAWEYTSSAANSWLGNPFHRARSFLAFTGGCGVVTILWPCWMMRKKPIAIALCLAVPVFLFSPIHDVLRPCWGADRLMGVVLSFGALLGLMLVAGRDAWSAPGWPLWAPWILSLVLFQTCIYWSILARLMVFMIAPMVLSMSEILEKGQPRKLTLFYGLSLSVVLALSLPLAVVDLRYAQAQKDWALRAVEFSGRGKKLWFAGHWGLQYYLEQAGAAPLDGSKSLTAQASSGDAVIISRVNSNSSLLNSSLPALINVKIEKLDYPIPLRLISSWSGWNPDFHEPFNEAGFYSSYFGFLPYAFSRESLDEFVIGNRP